MDVGNFLKDKAVIFEKLGKSRTFLIFDEEADEFRILAYYTLALQVLKVPDDFLSGNKTKNLDGFSSKIRGVKIREFPAILIGQLGKNEAYRPSIYGSDIMQYCLGTILEGQARVGGRIIMLECKDIPHLINLYQNFGFQKLEREYSEGELLQMIKILKEDELIDSSSYKE